MILAIDVYYFEKMAKTVGVLFDWNDEIPKHVIVDKKDGVDDYIPGEFYKRELPCIESLLKKIDLSTIDAIIVDGYIYIDNSLKYGLGGYLWELLDKKIPIIGVAKNSFYNNKSTVVPLFRGLSKKPLYISSVGYNLQDAVDKILTMKGEFRIPTILKTLDTFTKEV